MDFHAIRANRPNKQKEEIAFPRDLLNPLNLKVRGISGATFAEEMWSKLSAGGGVLNLVRHVGRALPAVGPQNPAMANLGLVTNGVNLLLHMNNVKKGIGALKHANRIGDGEGSLLAGSQIGSGVTLGCSSTFLLTGLIVDAGGWGGRISTIANVAGTSLIGAGSAIGIGISTYRLAQLIEFRKKLHRLENDPTATSAEAKARKILLGLKETLSVSKKEVYDLARSIDKKHSTLRLFEKETIFNRQYGDLIQVKINSLKRRSSMKSIHLIASQADLLLAMLDNKTTRELAIQQTASLVQTLKSDNAKKIAFYVAVLAASLFAFSAFLVATFFSMGGTIPFILLALSAGTALSAMATNWLATRFFKH